MRSTFVVPCYNEEHRLKGEEFLRLIKANDGIDLVFVDDGSTDGTLSVLEKLKNQAAARIFIVKQESNQGKAEAVRTGLLFALKRGAETVAYLDADLATPISEALRLLGRLQERPECQVLLASRVSLLGRHVNRSSSRHYAGRVFASFASAILKLRVYDTQCGAKFFRNGPCLELALAEPFLSRWAFDVELLARLTSGPAAIKTEHIVEEPLLMWRDVAGSKLGAPQMAGAAVDLARIAWSLRASSASD